MTTVLLIIHLLTALSLVALILMQQSEGGVLGVGGGSNSLFTARGASNVMSRATAILATIFFITSLTLTLLAGSAKPKSVIDTLKDSAVAPLIPLSQNASPQPAPPATVAPVAPVPNTATAPDLRPLPDLGTDAGAPVTP